MSSDGAQRGRAYYDRKATFRVVAPDEDAAYAYNVAALYAKARCADGAVPSADELAIFFASPPESGHIDLRERGWAAWAAVAAAIE